MWEMSATAKAFSLHVVGASSRRLCMYYLPADHLHSTSGGKSGKDHGAHTRDVCKIVGVDPPSPPPKSDSRAALKVKAI